MSQPVALYRKYRSRSLDELIGQDHVTHTLKQALKKQTISHAYLLTGPRGVGKTSTARIIAHEINELPYGDDTGQHLDIIEIDAASNRRIEEIRELRERIHVAPSTLKYKVYIIDEVHMLTNEAFNALLKTLEEPPAHAVFILATTEVHKLPATIVSRTQQFSFRPIAANNMSAHLRHIADKEGIAIADEALTVLAEHAQGSFRDAISLLDQIAAASHADKEIAADDVYALVGLASRSALESLVTLVTQGDDIAKVFDDIDQLHERGASMGTIAHQLAHYLRLALPKLPPPQQHDALLLIQDLLHAQASIDPKLKLQTVLSLFMSRRTQSTKPQAATTRSSSPTPPKPPKPPKPQTTSKPKASTTQKKPAEQATPSPAREQKSIKAGIVIEAWNDVMQVLRQEHTTLHAVLRQAQLHQDEERLILTFQYPLHMRKARKPENFDKLNAVINEVAGGTPDIDCVVAVKSPDVVSTAPEQGNESSMLEKLRGTLGGDIVQLS